MNREKWDKIKAVLGCPASSQGEKDNARRILEKYQQRPEPKVAGPDFQGEFEAFTGHRTSEKNLQNIISYLNKMSGLGNLGSAKITIDRCPKEDKFMITIKIDFEPSPKIYRYENFWSRAFYGRRGL